MTYRWKDPLGKVTVSSLRAPVHYITGSFDKWNDNNLHGQTTQECSYDEIYK